MSTATGLIIGVPLGAGLTMAAWAFTFAAVENRYLKHILALQRLIRSRTGPEVSPVVAQGMGKLAALTVSDGFCYACGSEHPGLKEQPFSPHCHRINDHIICPVPYCWGVYDDWRKKWPSSPLPKQRNSRTLSRHPAGQLENQKLLLGAKPPSRSQPRSE